MSQMESAYRESLAFIHDAGHGGHARAAAAYLMRLLNEIGRTKGVIVDLGCGSGILCEIVSSHGFDVLGIDISAGMLAIARKRAPRGTFRRQSLLDAHLPPCVAVVAVGECFNYLFDSNHSEKKLQSLFTRIYECLTPGGILLFDVATPGRQVGPKYSRGFALGDDWAVTFSAEVDSKHQVLTRNITSFRQVGKHYQRDHEIHRLRLIQPSEMARQVRQAGFKVRMLTSYGDYPLSKGLRGFLARKAG